MSEKRWAEVVEDVDPTGERTCQRRVRWSSVPPVWTLLGRASMFSKPSSLTPDRRASYVGTMGVTRGGMSRWPDIGRFAAALAGVVTLGCNGSQRETEHHPLPASVGATLPCERIIDSVDEPPEHYVPVLDAVALSDGAGTTRSDRGLRFAKSGLLVRAGRTVELSVEASSPLRLGWFDDVAATRLVVPACAGERAWIVFAGGFLVAEPGCFDVRVATEGRIAVTRVGVDAPCARQ